jgi:ABC-type branched-subunit amino acid transport system substrate-binding protein
VATTEVTTGVGAGFLQEAVNGMQAAINEANNSGGVCGRRITLDKLNDNWSRKEGLADIQGFINSGKVFALVGEPDSEGLGAAIDSRTVDMAGIPVVGTDGMLKDQYADPWVWPVAASTVTNMHIISKYAVDHGAKTFGIVYDNSYKFGLEGAAAFDAEVKRLTGHGIQGDDTGGSGCNGAFCGIPANAESGQGSSGYSSQIQTFNNTCHPCDAVVMLLEPLPMETWMSGEANNQSAWYRMFLMGGEPLFDDNLGSNCNGCGGHQRYCPACPPLMVWTGYHPAIQPFDSEKAVYTYAQSLRSVCPSCDAHNEFTEGAYLGAKLFIAACTEVGRRALPLTRENLRAVLDSMTYESGLSSPLHYGGLPHIANTGMAAFSVNFSGTFNGWNYDETGFIPDPAPGQDLQ